MLWNIYGNNFYEVKPIENIDIDIESSKLEEFVPKLMRLKLN
jgi:hypothetical protein